MREIRLSGLMRGGEFRGELTTTVGLISKRELSADSTKMASGRDRKPDCLTAKRHEYRISEDQRELAVTR